MARGWLKLVLLPALLLLWLTVCSCAEQRKETTEGLSGDSALPALTLTDDSDGILLTYIDGHGDAHTADKMRDVPKKWRKRVRVVTKDAGDGQLFYVADLRTKDANGSYPVSTMSRADWEALIAAKRNRHRAKNDDTRNKRDRSGLEGAGLRAIVYGADWCKLCHDATSFLRRRGVTVREVDIEKQAFYRREMNDKLRKINRLGGSIPVIDVSGIVVVGFDERRLENVIRRASQRQTL